MTHSPWFQTQMLRVGWGFGNKVRVRSGTLLVSDVGARSDKIFVFDAEL